MDLKSLNRPAIPVRHNRRTQLKPLSRLNGDWLPLLKKIKTSEMSQQVRGHNASEELRTRRLVGQWFGDYAWQLGKLKKAQSGAMTDLARIHLERRQLKRHMLLWRQEEARQEIERQRERESRREEMERVGREIERRTRQLQREGRRMSQRLNAALFPPGRRGSRSVNDANPQGPSVAADETDPAAALSAISESAGETAEKEEEKETKKETPISSAPIPPIHREPSNPMIKARVLEVTKNGPEPLVRTRTKSDLSEDALRSSTDIPSVRIVESPTDPPVATQDPIDLVLNSNQVLPPIKTSPEKVASSLAVPKRQRQRNEQRHRQRSDLLCVFPTIDEDKGLDLEAASVPESSSKATPASSSSSATSPSSVKRADSQTRLANANDNRERTRRRKEYQQAILKEPYNVYRRDSKGRLTAMDQAPAPPKFEEPTNRHAYRRSKLLRNERINFDDKMKTLETFTDNCVQEDMKLLNELQQPKVKQEEAKPRLDEKFEESKKLGPADWMRVFIHSTLPEGADPDAPESLHHCRYIRKDDHDAEEVADKQRRSRVTSWDPV